MLATRLHFFLELYIVNCLIQLSSIIMLKFVSSSRSNFKSVGSIFIIFLYKRSSSPVWALSKSRLNLLLQTMELLPEAVGVVEVVDTPEGVVVGVGVVGTLVGAVVVAGGSVGVAAAAVEEVKNKPMKEHRS